jgi:hypothetical protein
MWTGAFVQFRFTANHHEPPPGQSEWITGFQVARLRLLFRAEIEDVTRLRIRRSGFQPTPCR